MRTNLESNKAKTFLFSYFFDGSWWNIEIVANTLLEAKERLKSIQTAKFDGELKLVIDVPSNN
jgi:hypothetical protein